MLSVLEPPVVQGQRAERSQECDAAAQAPGFARLLRSPSEGSTAQGEHQRPAGEGGAAPPPGQHHQPGAEARPGAAADPHQAGRSVQGEGQELQGQGLPPEDAQRRYTQRRTGPQTLDVFLQLLLSV